MRGRVSYAREELKVILPSARRVPGALLSKAREIARGGRSSETYHMATTTPLLSPCFSLLFHARSADTNALQIALCCARRAACREQQFQQSYRSSSENVERYKRQERSSCLRAFVSYGENVYSFRYAIAFHHRNKDKVTRGSSPYLSSGRGIVASLWQSVSHGNRIGSA